MLEHINSVEKLLIISIPNLLAVLEVDKIPEPAPIFNAADYFSELEKGLFEIAFLHVLVERRLITPSRHIQDPPRLIHVPQIKSICKEHRKLRRCLHILRADIDLRQRKCYYTLQIVGGIRQHYVNKNRKHSSSIQ